MIFSDSSRKRLRVDGSFIFDELWAHRSAAVDEGSNFFVAAEVQRKGTILCLDWSIVIRTISALLEKPVLESLDLEPVLDLTSPAGQIIGNLVGTIMQGMRNNGPLLSSPVGLSLLSEAMSDLILRFTQHLLLSIWDKKYRQSPLGMFGALSTTCTQTSANRSRSQWLQRPSGSRFVRCRMVLEPFQCVRRMPEGYASEGSVTVHPLTRSHAVERRSDCGLCRSD